MLNNSIGGNGNSPKSICSNRNSPKSIYSDRGTPKFIGSNKSALEVGFSVLSKVESPGAKLSLKLFKSYSLLISMLGSS